MVLAETTSDVDRKSGGRQAPAIMVICVALIVIGLIMVASTSYSVRSSTFGSSVWRSAVVRQGIFAFVGLAGLAVVYRMRQTLLTSCGVVRYWPVALLCLVVLALAATFIPQLASESHGSRRWLRLGPESFGVGFQPSEFAKLAMVAFMAWLLSRPSANPQAFFRGFVPAAAVVGALVGLVGVEDFGTAALIGVVGGLLMFVAGCRWLHLIISALIGAAGFVGLIWMEPYRLRRISAFLDPAADPLGSGYHPTQSLLTIASGSWSGTGLGTSMQARGYLPECSTDFIFSVICEEMGIAGGMLVTGMFIVLVWLGLSTMLSAATRFQRLIAFGVTATIGLQAAMNIAVATVVAPTTGISLPLISAGGSGLLVYCVSLGLLAAVARNSDVSSSIESSVSCELEGSARLDDAEDGCVTVE